MTPEARDELTGLALGSMSMFRARHVDLGMEVDRNPVQAWDLPVIAGQYEAFIRRWRSLLPAVNAGEVTGAAAVRARTELMDTCRHFFPTLDPLLPIELLPRDWPSEEAERCGAVLHSQQIAGERGRGAPSRPGIMENRRS